MSEEKYQPSREEIRKAEDMMPPDQWRASREREESSEARFRSTPPEKRQEFIDVAHAEALRIKERNEKLFGSIEVQNICYPGLSLGMIGFESTKIKNEKIRAVAEALEKEVKQDFPKTYRREITNGELTSRRLEFFHDQPEKIAEIEEDYRKNVEWYDDYRRKSPRGYSYPDFPDSKSTLRGIEKAGQLSSLYHITSFLKGKLLDSEHIRTELRQVLEGKKILVLGDDIGSLSELLRSFGAEAYGIEFGEDNIEIAHSGIMSENGEPQNQVIEGDITELIIQDSNLSRKIKEIGAFDVIFSNAVLNVGSGIELGFDKYAEHNHLEKRDGRTYEIIGRRLLIALNDFLNDNGFQVHENSGIGREFGQYHGTGQDSHVALMPKSLFSPSYLEQ